MRETSLPTTNYQIILEGMDAYKHESEALASTLRAIVQAESLQQAKELAALALSYVGTATKIAQPAEELRYGQRAAAKNIRKARERRRIERGMDPNGPVAPVSPTEFLFSEDEPELENSPLASEEAYEEWKRKYPPKS